MQADLERRFGSLRRLYGDAGYARLRSARIAVVGLGGVGSWTVEALARCGVAGLVLVDYDHIAESNINRQAQAHSLTLGQAKGEALRERIALIHPGCDVSVVDDFATPDNFRVQTARAQVAALRGQIAAAQAAAKTNGGPSVGVITPKISEYENLYRDEKYAEAEYEIYKRYLDTTAVQTLSAGINLDVIEPPYVDPDRQFNVRPLGALILVLLAAVIAEVYIADAPAMGAPRRTQ